MKINIRPKHNEPTVYYLVTDDGWRFKGEQDDPHRITYRASSDRVSLLSDAYEAAQELEANGFVIPCECGRCVDEAV